MKNENTPMNAKLPATLTEIRAAAAKSLSDFATMTIQRDNIECPGIRAAMEKACCAEAELLGTFEHETYGGGEWDANLYRAAGSLVFETLVGPVWLGDPDFDALEVDYGLDLSTLEEFR